MKINLSPAVTKTLVAVAVVTVMVVIFVAIVLLSRWTSQATQMERIITPRPGIECLIISANDGVAVSCYPVPGEGK
jgi:hypothetical protein